MSDDTIDLLINNAGLALGIAPAQKADLAHWRQMVDTNITGLMAITHKLLPGLVERRGAIINLSSVAASYPYPGGNVYGGTKAFVSQFSLGLRSDLHGTGVRVTSIEPGMVETEFTKIRNGGNQAAHDALYGGADPLDVLLDVALDDELLTTFSPEIAGENHAAYELRGKLWHDDRTLVGASDAGAHLDLIEDRKSTRLNSSHT